MIFGLTNEELGAIVLMVMAYMGWEMATVTEATVPSEVEFERKKRQLRKNGSPPDVLKNKRMTLVSRGITPPEVSSDLDLAAYEAKLDDLLRTSWELPLPDVKGFTQKEAIGKSRTAGQKLWINDNFDSPQGIPRPPNSIEAQ